MSLSTKIVIALVAGLACGLFFGESVDFLGVAGKAFILLLQMSVIPYIAVSLVAGLGGLTLSGALDLAKRAGVFLLIIWVLALGAVALMPLAFPDWPAASFFSTSLVQPDTQLDFLSLFIPANPFYSLSAAVVPSVVVFSIALGVALIGVERKQTLLEPLKAVAEALASITTFVVRLAPYGVFAIVAQAAGTMDPSEIKGVEVYVAVYAVTALVLCLWTLPALVALMTPFRYREVVWDTRDALVTAFATGSVLVVLAVLAEKSKQILRTHPGKPGDSQSFVDVVVPTAFTFPSAGKLLSLGFILFAGWLSGFAVPLGQYPAFILSGLAAFFGSTMLAVPFLLDLFQIPSDTFQLFVIVDSVAGNRFGAAVAAMTILSLALLSSCAMAGTIRFRPARLVGYLAVTFAITIAAILGIRLLFEAAGSEYLGYKKFIAMTGRIDPVQTRLVDGAPAELPAVDRSIPTLVRIRQRGFLRVGYTADSLPYAFRNEGGQLVGFDIDLGNLLARELGVSIEWVLIDRKDIPRLVNSGYLDTVMGGTALTTDRMEVVSFAESHMEETLAFIVRDHRRHEFSSRDKVKAMESLRLAVPNVKYYLEKLRAYLPQAELVPIDSVREFFRHNSDQYDGLVLTAQSGSAWSLIYPEFSVAVPRPDTMSVPLAYPVARGDLELVEFLSSWVQLKKKDGTIDDLFAHWILGEATKTNQPRWSVIRDVFGWVDGTHRSGSAGPARAVE